MIMVDYSKHWRMFGALQYNLFSYRWNRWRKVHLILGKIWFRFKRRTNRQVVIR